MKRSSALFLALVSVLTVSAQHIDKAVADGGRESAVPTTTSAIGQGGVENQNQPSHISVKKVSAVSQFDVNGDGVTDAGDIVDIVLYVKGSPRTVFAKAKADVNGDKKIDIEDAKALSTLITGGEVTAPQGNDEEDPAGNKDNTPSDNPTPGDDPSAGDNPTPGDDPSAGDNPTPGDDPSTGEDPTPGEDPSAGEDPTSPSNPTKGIWGNSIKDPETP